MDSDEGARHRSGTHCLKEESGRYNDGDGGAECILMNARV